MEQTEKPPVEEVVEAEPKSDGKTKAFFKRLFATKKRKIVAASVGVIVVIGVLCLIPMTRYALFGTFMKKDVTILISDISTKRPVSQAMVTIDGKTATTKADGRVTISNVPVGEHSYSVEKKYYKSSSAVLTVPILGNLSTVEATLTATGRQVQISVVNKISTAALSKVLIHVGDTSATTDDKGIATIVLPADKAKVTGEISLDGFNTISADIQVSEKADVNKLALTPSGKVFYLSKLTGKINVMQSNLDGTESKVVVGGTGNERDDSTSLLAARDWRYLALLARRDSGQTRQLFAVDAKLATSS